ncbi:MAG: HD domain-containing protein [Candidatus Bipolaricaulota bacterium]|nr:HD domain-containing protein [Candidatus Bipolaricaulota bacterium]
MVEGLTIGRREGPRDTAVKPSTTLELLAREGPVEVTRQHIKAGKVFYLDEEASWQGFEFVYVISGLLALKQGEGEVPLSPGDYAYHHGLAERAYFHVREDTELLMVASPPSFQIMRDEIVDMMSLGRSVEEKDSATEGHSQRIEELVVATGELLGLTGEQLIVLSHAAYLHDIGKVSVSDAILNKPGPLTDEEREEMRRHPASGAKILARKAFLKEAAEIVLAHHERFDGTGYPNGLRGEEIPIEARILAVADAYDAMSSPRPYGAVRSKPDARGEVTRNAGTQFDPAVVTAFFSVVEAFDA